MLRHSRAAVLSAALFAATIAAAAAGQTAQIVPIHGAQPKAMTLSMQAHGMMSSAKHGFAAKHKLTSKKAAMHGFAGAKGNGKGTM